MISGREATITRKLSESLVSYAAWAGIAFLAVFIFHATTSPLRNGDLYWQVRAGADIIDTGLLPTMDSYSYIIGGHPWNNHQWGWEIIAAAMYRAWGWGAFRIFILVVMGGAIAAIGIVMGRKMGPSFALFAMTIFIVLAHYKFIPATQTISMALFLFAFRFFGRGTTFGSTRRTLLLFGLLLVWGNLTAEVVAFLPFIIVDQFFLAALAEKGGLLPWEEEIKERAGKRIVLLAGLACCIPLLNPPGSSVLNYAIEGLSVNASVNGEFYPITAPAFTVPWGTKQLARALIAFLLCLMGWRFLKSNNRLREAREISAELLCVVGAALQERNLWMLIIPVCGALAVVDGLPLYGRNPKWFRMGALVLSATIFTPYLMGIGWSPAIFASQIFDRRYYSSHLDERDIPKACVEYVDARYRGTRVFTRRLWASYLIFGARQNRVFFDGRNREYPEYIQRAGQAVVLGAPAAAWILNTSHTDVVIGAPSWGAGNQALRRDWQAEFVGPSCAVFTRRERAPAGN